MRRAGIYIKNQVVIGIDPSSARVALDWDDKQRNSYFIEKGQSAAQVIENLAFTTNGPLLKEFDNLFASFFEDSEAYIELIRIIAKNHYGTAQADISKKSKNITSGGRISSKLNKLEEAGFIIKFTPYEHKKREYITALLMRILYYIYIGLSKNVKIYKKTL